MSNAPRQMGVSRTTVTEMYERARYKIADCIVNGKILRITLVGIIDYVRDTAILLRQAV